MSPAPATSLKTRMESARAALPGLRTKYLCLPSADQTFLGKVPEKVQTLTDVLTVEKFQARLAAAPAPAKVAPAAVKPTPAMILDAAVNPAINSAAIEGLNQSLAARLGVTEQKFCTKGEFDSLTPAQRSQFIGAGGRISPEPKAMIPAPAPGAKSMSAAQLAAYVPAQKQAAFFRDGGSLTE